jgi:hypothetical protein
MFISLQYVSTHQDTKVRMADIATVTEAQAGALLLSAAV